MCMCVYTYMVHAKEIEKIVDLGLVVEVFNVLDTRHAGQMDLDWLFAAYDRGPFTQSHSK